MAAYKTGLVNVLIGPIAGDGGMGTVLTAVGDTVKGSPTFSAEDPTKTDFETEESPNPVFSIVSKQGKRSFSWSTFNIDADTMIKFFGGTKVAGTPEKWVAPANVPDIEVSLRLVWATGGSIDFPRTKINGKENFSFKKEALSQIDITADILTPTKPGLADHTITYS